MASVLRKLKTLGYMLLPYGYHELQRQRKSRIILPSNITSLLAVNRELAGRHAGERCFILGNGPSAKALDLSKLRGETVISVSNGYLHSNYADFMPKYHCVPQITYGLMTDEDVVTWFNEMHAHLGGAELFLSTTEAPLVEQRKLFAGRQVHYQHFAGSVEDYTNKEIVDISKPAPGVESVPVMALTIAMFLGFKTIVLLGVDHDHFRSARYDYAFELKVQKGKDSSLHKDGTLKISRYDEFHSLARLWRQYRFLSQIAQANGIRIVNSTPGGELDEFERVDFDLWLHP
ncbi:MULTISPECIES: hypothetical protein [Rhizobium]|uniref:hypothetical protein n=1 Tax=Rhizobium TaxID=379 RepID=UPI0005230B68|nr:MULTISPECIES: hypothetical protein [Rhizobium]KPN26522.1 hypothetical protein KS05_15840 [Rhizobium brockwellii]MDV4153140.1 hypothetical protein [Rhizobium brockwellii]QJX03828.1 hypothetical protein RLCC275e_02140 [Rhizobium brockwellii]